MSTPTKPHNILKKLRLQKGLKQSELAAKTGFPVSTLSKMENGKVSLTYDKLAKISKALNVDIGIFFTNEPSPPPQNTGRRSIIRKDDGRILDTENYCHRFVATELLNKRFIPMFGGSYAKSIEEFGPLTRHDGEEFTYIIEGVLELHTELYAPVRLAAGDSIYFDSSMGHAYIDVGDVPCRALIICSGDESKLTSTLEKE